MSTRRLLIAFACSTALLLGACSSSSDTTTGTTPGTTPGTAASAGGTGSTPEPRPGTTAAKGERYTVTGDETLTVASGSTFQIALEANKTTGYNWTQQISGTSVDSEGEDYEAPSGDAVGAGGTQVFTYEAVEPGTSTIELTYAQVGSGDVGQRYTVTVDVT